MIILFLLLMLRKLWCFNYRKRKVKTVINLLCEFQQIAEETLQTLNFQYIVSHWLILVMKYLKFVNIKKMNYYSFQIIQ